MALDVGPNRSNPAELLVTMVRDDPQPLGHDGLPGDYHLATGSPAINAGTDSFGGVGAPFDDIDLEVRPQDGGLGDGRGRDTWCAADADRARLRLKRRDIEGDEGEVAPGALLTATTGGWTGTPPFTFAFQWQREGSPWSNIAGATSRTYEVKAADVGHRLRVRRHRQQPWRTATRPLPSRRRRRSSARRQRRLSPSLSRNPSLSRPRPGRNRWVR